MSSMGLLGGVSHNGGAGQRVLRRPLMHHNVVLCIVSNLMPDLLPNVFGALSSQI